MVFGGIEALAFILVMAVILSNWERSGAGALGAELTGGVGKSSTHSTRAALAAKRQRERTEELLERGRADFDEYLDRLIPSSSETTKSTNSNSVQVRLSRHGLGGGSFTISNQQHPKKSEQKRRPLPRPI